MMPNFWITPEGAIAAYCRTSRGTHEVLAKVLPPETTLRELAALAALPKKDFLEKVFARVEWEAAPVGVDFGQYAGVVFD